MKVKRLELKNFRNYESQIFEFDDNVNIIHGFNAQGKTNILEAIYLFSLGKSNRTIKENEMIKFGEDLKPRSRRSNPLTVFRFLTTI